MVDKEQTVNAVIGKVKERKGYFDSSLASDHSNAILGNWIRALCNEGEILAGEVERLREELKK